MTDEHTLLESANRDGELRQDQILRLYADLDQEDFQQLVDGMVEQGLLEPVEAGAYRITDQGRAEWARLRKATEAGEHRNIRTWQP